MSENGSMCLDHTIHSRISYPPFLILESILRKHCSYRSFSPSPSSIVTMTLVLIDVTSMITKVIVNIKLRDMWRSHAYHAFLIFPKCKRFEHVHSKILSWRCEQCPSSFISGGRTQPQCRRLGRGANTISILLRTKPINNKIIIKKVVPLHPLNTLLIPFMSSLISCDWINIISRPHVLIKSINHYKLLSYQSIHNNVVINFWKQ